MKIVKALQYDYKLNELIDQKYLGVQSALFCQRNGLLYLSDIIAYLKNPYNDLRIYAIRNKRTRRDMKNLLNQFKKSSFPPHFERVPCRIGLNMRRLTVKNQRFLLDQIRVWINELTAIPKKKLLRLMPELSGEGVETFLFDKSRDWRTYALCSDSTVEELKALQLDVIMLFNGLQAV
jgi:hypothetical protein